MNFEYPKIDKILFETENVATLGTLGPEDPILDIVTSSSAAI